MNAFGYSLFPLTDRYHDALFAPASVGDLQRLVELVPCGVRFRNPILLQFAADLRDLFLHILQLAHDHRERRQHGLHVFPVPEHVPDFHIVFRNPHVPVHPLPM